MKEQEESFPHVEINNDNLRTEYSALSSYFNTIVTFRFTTVGFFIAAVGLIVGSSPSKEKAFLLLGISISLWLLELRNRSLFTNLAYRGIQIEREFWGYRGLSAYDPFYSRQIKVKPAIEKDSEATDLPPPDYPKILFWEVKIPISHTVAFDLLYFIVIVFAIIQLFSLNNIDSNSIIN